MLGQGFSYILIGLGIAGLLGADVPVVAGDFVSALWLIFIGMFLGQAARSATYQTAVLSRIEGITVSDVMDAEPVAIPGDMTVGDALHEYFLRYRYDWFPVVDAQRASSSGSWIASAPSASPTTARRCSRSERY